MKKNLLVKDLIDDLESGEGRKDEVLKMMVKKGGTGLEKSALENAVRIQAMGSISTGITPMMTLGDMQQATEVMRRAQWAEEMQRRGQQQRPPWLSRITGVTL